MADEIDYKLIGDDMQAVIITLTAGAGCLLLLPLASPADARDLRQRVMELLPRRARRSASPPQTP